MSKLLLFTNWQIAGALPDGIRKYVIVAGTHTSNWDYILMLVVTRRLGLRPKVLIKKQAFFPPLGWLLRYFGGIPVDRANPQSAVKEIVRQMELRDEFVLIITPEGTRTSSGNLKSGFYRIAKQANLRIMPATVHADKKTVCLHPTVEATRKEETLARVASIFQQSKGLRKA